MIVGQHLFSNVYLNHKSQILNEYSTDIIKYYLFAATKIFPKLHKGKDERMRQKAYLINQASTKFTQSIYRHFINNKIWQDIVIALYFKGALQDYVK